MKHLSLYRKRLIPNEILPLSDDRILFYDAQILVTAWNTIRPKKDLDHGFSCYFLEEGCKVSKFYRADGTLLYIYCDIISPFLEENTGRLIVTDLLADVIVYPDGSVRVVDLDELVSAHDAGLLSTDQLKAALLSLHRLLERIYAGQLPQLLAKIECFEN